MKVGDGYLYQDLNGKVYAQETHEDTQSGKYTNTQTKVHN